MAEIRTFHETIAISDETEMVAYVASPEQEGLYPALLLFQEIFGVNEHIRQVADRLAAEGYMVVAPDIFHRSSPGFESGYEDLQPGRTQAAALTPEGLKADIKACYEWLQHHPHVAGDRIGSMGFCLGGRLSFLANAWIPLKAAVSFYGAGIAENHLELCEYLHAPQLFFWAGQDPWIQPESHQKLTQKLRELKKDFVTVEFANVDHGFACDARSNYDFNAARQAWSLSLSFLDSYLKKY
ncbi:dienelactone hydrolase family protein [bacterium (Candidatus Blackallbacteria) CG17_big_fil_post_rev_8_21_14_2_50_48_46]|uniref:Dienelactone hydrolase family protein n=1 Tax=bacterium (Candidatus Blackallbacteria) CG17_big_fil_post_rev_8_21_14_2_50_48_46 TaxID=2014261 RepID=A0A2M7G8L5_9BACT|nr:MAG: dienelactone hydrolase [bacterium (Candidatus Blackallbacteria) CG18_big_fil_WC_8_21_14_2_50_49_26]PIW18442.1 MAG: dienelactone hydrolase family protein [bacterium (Candidatus Blackallbacteria) CG17_big_fil_post_rev_8_21_14_2_50_48_46]PIW46573.1 MAG: dienelactone hydrolase family protein [bacterium (Candidatus Blackallbacteria) CG13_big_fil_rev_8_21_14_2_50_49_14]